MIDQAEQHANADDEPTPRSHYAFRLSLRVRHPLMAPQDITAALGVEPRHYWQADEPRRTPTGRLLAGSNRETYWVIGIAEGRWRLSLNQAVFDALRALVPVRPFLHRIRAEGGTTELLIGWFFDRQSGDTLKHDCLALAGDLQVDLSLDVYPPEVAAENANERK